MNGPCLCGDPLCQRCFPGSHACGDCQEACDCPGDRDTCSGCTDCEQFKVPASGTSPLSYSDAKITQEGNPLDDLLKAVSRRKEPSYEVLVDYTCKRVRGRRRLKYHKNSRRWTKRYLQRYGESDWTIPEGQVLCTPQMEYDPIQGDYKPNPNRLLLYMNPITHLALKNSEGGPRVHWHQAKETG